MGVSRIGSLVKNLMLKSDRLFHLVVICTEWPTIELFDKIFLLLSDKYHVRKINHSFNKLFFDFNRIFNVIKFMSLFIYISIQMKENYQFRFLLLHYQYKMMFLHRKTF